MSMRIQTCADHGIRPRASFNRSSRGSSCKRRASKSMARRSRTWHFLTSATSKASGIFDRHPNNFKHALCLVYSAIIIYYVMLCCHTLSTSGWHAILNPYRRGPLWEGWNQPQFSRQSSPTLGTSRPNFSKATIMSSLDVGIGVAPFAPMGQSASQRIPLAVLYSCRIL